MSAETRDKLLDENLKATRELTQANREILELSRQISEAQDKLKKARHAKLRVVAVV